MIDANVSVYQRDILRYAKYCTKRVYKIFDNFGMVISGRTCSSPDQPDNGSLKPKKNTYYSGDKLWFSCEAGYTLEGKKDLLCQNNGQWNAEFPICVGT